MNLFHLRVGVENKKTQRDQRILMLTIKKKLPKKCHNGNLRPTDKEKLLST